MKAHSGRHVQTTANAGHMPTYLPSYQPTYSVVASCITLPSSYLVFVLSTLLLTAARCRHARHCRRRCAPSLQQLYGVDTTLRLRHQCAFQYRGQPPQYAWRQVPLAAKLASHSDTQTNGPPPPPPSRPHTTTYIQSTLQQHFIQNRACWIFQLCRRRTSKLPAAHASSASVRVCVCIPRRTSSQQCAVARRGAAAASHYAAAPPSTAALQELPPLALRLLTVILQFYYYYYKLCSEFWRFEMTSTPLHTSYIPTSLALAL